MEHGRRAEEVAAWLRSLGAVSTLLLGNLFDDAAEGDSAEHNDEFAESGSGEFRAKALGEGALHEVAGDSVDDVADDTTVLSFHQAFR